jgi:hypothetical protein
MHHVPRPSPVGKLWVRAFWLRGRCRRAFETEPCTWKTSKKGPFGERERAQLYLGFIFCLKVSLGFVCVVECCEVSWLGVERLAEAQAYLSARV